MSNTNNIYNTKYDGRQEKKIHCSFNMKWVNKPMTMNDKGYYELAEHVGVKISENGFGPMLGEYTNTSRIGPVNTSTGWQNCFIDIEEVMEMIRNGLAICPLLKDKNGNETDIDGYRAARTFVGTNIALVDVDNGMTIEEACKHEFYKKHGSGFYTTPSHTNEKHRFRLMFALERVITDTHEMSALNTALIIKFGGDEACKDASRQYYGCNFSDRFEVNPERFIQNNVIDELIGIGKKLKEETTNNVTEYKNGTEVRRAKLNNKLWLNPDDMIKTSRGNYIRVGDVKGHVPNVFCPFHDDKKGTEFMKVTPNGTPYLVCLNKCNGGKGIFMRHEGEDKKFDKWIAEKKKAQEEREVIHDEEKPTPSVEIINERYLPPLKRRRGVSFIKSGKGTGKTERLCRDIISSAKAEEKSVLVIGHRISLLRSLSRRLGVDFYQEKTNPTKYYAVCLDSIAKSSMFMMSYDIIILDESEQILQHATGSTFKKRRTTVIPEFFNVVQRAREVYCLDADMSLLTCDTMIQQRGKDDEYYALLNEYRNHKNVTMFFDNDMLMDRLMSDLEKNERVFFVSNSRRRCEITKTIIKKLFPEKRVLSITSANVDLKKQQEFLDDVDNGCLDYDVVICSPVMSTGIDIQAKYKRVYGWFEGNINTHYDIDQQLSRVRNADELCVYFTNRYNNNLDNHGRIYEYITTNNERANDILGYDYNKKEVVSGTWQWDYLWLVCRAKAQRGYSINNLWDSWKNMCEERGWSVKENSSKSTSRWFEKIEEDYKKLKADAHGRIIAADIISRKDYEELKNRKRLSQQEKDKKQKYEIMDFYGLIHESEMSRELVEKDQNEQLRMHVMNYINYKNDDDKACDYDLYEREVGIQISDRKNIYQRKLMLKNILSVVGLNTLSTNILLKKDDVAGVVSACESTGIEFYTLFGKRITNKMKQEPMRLLQSIVKLTGMKLVCVKEKKVKDENGKRKTERWFGIDEDYAELVHTLAHNKTSFRNPDEMPTNDEFEQIKTRFGKIVDF